MKKIITILTFAFLAVSAHAQPPGTHPSYVSIQMASDPIDSASQKSSVCGGVVVDEIKKIVATAWHCVPNDRSKINKPGAFFVNGMNAKFIAFSNETDIALFEVSGLKGIKAPTFTTPKKGDEVAASAYYDNFGVSILGSDRFFPPMSISTTLDWSGKVVAVAAAQKRTGENFDKIVPTPYKWILVGGIPAPGFSGGPVFDKSGGLIGILSNVTGGFTAISSSENIAILLKNMGSQK